MTRALTYVDDQRYIFTSEIDTNAGRTFVAVHWTALAFDASDAFVVPLRKYIRERHEITEVWIVYPRDLSSSFATLRLSERFPTHDDIGMPRLHRFFTVDEHGQLHEENTPSRDAGALVVSEGMASYVIEDGLRQLFRDTDSLATATSGYHFVHPSGVHSDRFIRASQSVSRTQHAFFVAMALLARMAPAPSRTVWVDSASISSVGYAYAELLRRLGVATSYKVETFGGHSGLPAQLQPSTGDVVVISGTTSGSLAKRAIADKGVPATDVFTLFYLCADEPNDENVLQHGVVLCDLTSRPNDLVRPIRDARIEPYVVYRTGTCELCETGHGTIELEGDSFFPATGGIDLRMPSLIDRPLARKRARSGRPATDFDGQDYFEDLYGHNAIVYSRGTPVDGAAYSVTTRIEHLLDTEADSRPARRIVKELQATMPDVVPAAVVSLTDNDSAALGRFAARRFFGDACREVSTDSGTPWRVWRGDGVDSFDSLPDDGVLLICAGVIASGRLVSSISRELRQVKGKYTRRVFIVAAHPQSAASWDIFEKSMERVSSDQVAPPMTTVWRLPREARSPHESTPWDREGIVLDNVGAWLASRPEHAELRAAIDARRMQLSVLTNNQLFVGSRDAGRDTGMYPLRANFALWPFDWTTHEHVPPGTVPTHAEIYATVAHLLYESRRINPVVDQRTINARRHGYALHPAIFDRFNDPVIQAAILRASAPGELQYDLNDDASHTVADILIFTLKNANTEAGGAAYEFLLSLAEGLQEGTPYGLRISAPMLKRVVDVATNTYGPTFEELDSAPRLRALLLYVQRKCAPA